MSYSMQVKGLLGVLLGFIILTVYIALTAEHSILVETSQMLSDVSTLQFHIFVDIYILTILFCFWVVKDSRELNFSTTTSVVFVVLSLSLISIGVLPYLIYRAWYLNAVNLHD